ncbi:unnamed protein product [Rotaria sp. Silwood1]|nr:unnamed protein product [Rotaria sp. Silwood1]
MQVCCISRLTSNTMKRACPIVRKLLQAESLRTTSLFRSSSTGTDQQNQNNDKKKNIINLIYILGGLTGAGMIYSVIRNRKISREKEQALTKYDDTNKTLVEKVKDLQDRQSLGKITFLFS